MFKWIFFLAFVTSFSVNAQYTVNYYYQAGKNPGNLNRDFEQVNSNYQTLFPFWQTPREIYFPYRSLPFPFVFYGDSVSRYRVSNTGMVSFESGPLPPVINQRIPSPLLAPKTIAIWGLKQKGGNDAIFAKTFGHSPNRQHWIYFHSFSADTTNLNNDAHWAVVLCETSNIIYVVDMGSYQSPLNLTIGLQNDSMNALELRGSPNIASQLLPNQDSFTSEDNSYYEFIPGTRKSRDLDLAHLELSDFLKIDQPFSFIVKYRDLGTVKTDSVCISYTIDNSSIIFTDTIFLNTIGNDFYKDDELVSKWVPTGSERGVEIKYWIHDGKGGIDQNATNDTIRKNIYLIPANRWPKKYLLESFESAKLAYSPESKLNMIYAEYLNKNFTSVAWHNDSLYQDSMAVQNSSRLSNYFNMSLPQGLINRKKWPSSSTVNLDRNLWPIIADSLPTVSSPCQIKIYGNDFGNHINVNVQTRFTDSISSRDKQLTILLIEDSVQGIGDGFNQVNFFNNQLDHPFWNYGSSITNYIHRKVVRFKVPSNSIWGIPNVIPAIPVLDSTYSFQTQITIPPYWNKSKMSIIAFVSYHDLINSNHEIINVGEVKLLNLITSNHNKSVIKDELILFPNPLLNGNLTLNTNSYYDGVLDVSIYQIDGKLVMKEAINFDFGIGQIETSGLNKGTYFIILESERTRYSTKFIKSE